MSFPDPLPASTFERYMLADDTAAHPMTFLMRFEFRGEAQRAVLAAAFEETLAAHPLLTARPHPRHGRSWEFAAQSALLDWNTLDVPLTCPRQVGIDLQREASFRLWCRVGEGRTELTLQAHHACCDGLGALQFLFDMFARYHRAVLSSSGTEAPPADWVRAIDPALLATRDDIRFTPPEKVSAWQALRGISVEASKLLLRSPQVFAGKNAAAPTATESSTLDLPRLHGLHLSPEVSEAYRDAAKARSVMVNDLFLRDMFVSLAEWAEHCGRPYAPQHWLRLTMPMNLRKREQGKMSAANVISYAFITRRVAETKQPDALLQSIHTETEAIKYWRIGGMFLAGVSVLDKVRLLKPLLRAPLCFSSMVVSNLGDIRHSATARFPLVEGQMAMGDLVLENYCAAPPPRSKTQGALVVSRYAGRFSLGLQTNRQIDAASAVEFLELYARQIEQTAEQAS